MLLFLFLEGRQARGAHGGSGGAGVAAPRGAASGAPWWQVLLTCAACAVIQSPTFNTDSSGAAPGVCAFSYESVSCPRLS